MNVSKLTTATFTAPVADTANTDLAYGLAVSYSGKTAQTELLVSAIRANFGHASLKSLFDDVIEQAVLLVRSGKSELSLLKLTKRQTGLYADYPVGSTVISLAAGNGAALKRNFTRAFAALEFGVIPLQGECFRQWCERATLAPATDAAATDATDAAATDATDAAATDAAAPATDAAATDADATDADATDATDAAATDAAAPATDAAATDAAAPATDAAATDADATDADAAATDAAATDAAATDAAATDAAATDAPATTATKYLAIGTPVSKEAHKAAIEIYDMLKDEDEAVLLELVRQIVIKKHFAGFGLTLDKAVA